MNILLFISSIVYGPLGGFQLSYIMSSDAMNTFYMCFGECISVGYACIPRKELLGQRICYPRSTLEDCSIVFQRGRAKLYSTQHVELSVFFHCSHSCGSIVVSL